MKAPTAFHGIIAPLHFLWNRSRLAAVPSPQLEVELKRILCATLRRFPRWWNGHLKLANAAITTGDVAQAYASALVLITASRFPLDATALIARSYLARGEGRRAIEWFSKLPLPHPSAVLEDVAAAHLLLQEFEEARRALLSIPSDDRTQSARAVLTFVQGKLSK